MKLLFGFALLLLAGLTAAAPTTSDDDVERVIVTKDFYPLSFVKYKSDHDIVNLLIPLNNLNFDENDSSSSEEDGEVLMFFVEADLDGNNKPTYKGLYLYKNNKATKILENGRDAAATTGDDKLVFFAADDGLYKYNPDTNEAVKYGSITDSIIGIAKKNDTDTIYILTENQEVFKVTDNGNTKTKVDEVGNVQQIVLDYSDNLYYYGEDKKVKVLTADGVKDIEGLPANPTEVTLLKPPFIIDDGVPAIVDNHAYFVYANGSSEFTGFEFKPKTKPSAYGMEATLIQYYAYNKKIYEYNLITMVLGEIMDELKSFLEDKSSNIQNLAKNKRNKIKS